MTRPAVRIATAGVGVGFVVMLLTLYIIIGFKREIQEKVTGFGSHIQLVNFDNNQTYQMKAIAISDSLLESISAIDGVAAAIPFCTKPGILKTDSAFHGIVLKGRGTTEQATDFFEKNLSEGHMPEKQNEVLLSERMSKLLRLTTGDKCYCYFVDEQTRVRKYLISGLYDSQFSDFDELFIIGTLDEVQRLNGFEEDEVSGVEVLLNDFSRLDEVAEAVYFMTANKPDKDGNMLYTETIEEMQPGIFAWLRLLDMNVIIIILLMMCVSGFCIISGLIIIVLDNIQQIGTIKALGADNRLIRKIFMYQSLRLTGRGLLYGNIIGLTLGALQHFLHIVPLDPATYYVSYVPVYFSPTAWLLLNAVCVSLSLLVLAGPAEIACKVSPADVMRFD